jgi:hypothetical protein
MTEMNFRTGRITGKTTSWYASSLDRSNACCIYCGVYLRGENPPASDKEHLIARNFVPKGTMDCQPFNFLFRTCRQCNSRKASAERHVSSVTLFNSPGRNDDTKVDEVAIKKGKGDYHPRKPGVPIEESHEHKSFITSLGPMSVKFGMHSPPQLDKDLVGEVAFSHIQGLFTLICTEDYLDPQKMRLLPQDQFLWFDSYTHNDWGNPQAVEIANRVRNWTCLANIESAQGYFKAIMRCSDEGWFWALEWNRHLRLLGGIATTRMKLFEDLPSEGWISAPQGRMRREIPLEIKDDHLFSGTV